MIINFFIAWYFIGHLITVPAIFKQKFPWDWGMWKFLIKGRAWGKMVELFLMAILIYPWFNPFAAAITVFIKLCYSIGKSYKDEIQTPTKKKRQK